MLLRMAIIAVVVAQCENQILAQTEPTGWWQSAKKWRQANIDREKAKPAKSMWERYAPSEEVYELGAQEESYRPLIKQYFPDLRNRVYGQRAQLQQPWRPPVRYGVVTTPPRCENQPKVVDKPEASKPLAKAINAADPEAVLFLLLSGVPVHKEDLARAIQVGDPEIVNTLLMAGVPVGTADIEAAKLRIGLFARFNARGLRDAERLQKGEQIVQDLLRVAADGQRADILQDIMQRGRRTYAKNLPSDEELEQFVALAKRQAKDRRRGTRSSFEYSECD
jgi:hypothetical protein